MTAGAPRTIFVAIDTTWTSLGARLRAGDLPRLAELRDRGVRARITPTSGRLPPPWPAIMSGTPSPGHGIVAADEPWAGGLRPIGTASWRAAPFWERFEAAGLATIGVGWPHIVPGAAWSGTQVDDRLGDPSGPDWDDWYLPRDVAPPAVRDSLRDVRVHPADIDGAMLRPFVPDIAVVDQRRDRRLIDIALAIARFSTNYAAFAGLVAARPFALAAWRCDLFARVASLDGAAAPFDRAMAAAWALFDGALGELARTMREQDTLILASPGIGNGAGVLLAAGPGLPAGVELPAIGPLDLVPSLLARYGLRDEALSGSARLNAPPALRSAPGPALPAPAPAPDPADLDRVAQFGLAPPAPDPRATARRLLSVADTRLLADPAAAATLAERALTLIPTDAAAFGLLAAARAAAGDFDALPAIADRLETIAPDHAWLPLIRGGFHAWRREAAAAIPLLRTAEAAGGPAEWMRIAAGWLMLRRPAEARRLFARTSDMSPDDVDALIGLGMTSGRDWIAAERAYRRALLLDPGNQRARDGIARILKRTGREA